MKVLRFIPLLCIAIFPTVSGADEVTDLLKESVEVAQGETLQIRQELSEELMGPNMKVQFQMQLINGMRIADKQPAKIRQQEMIRLRSRLAMLEKIEAYASSNHDDQATKLSEAQAELKELQEVQQEMSKPAQKKFIALYQKYNARHKELADVMTSYFREKGEGDFASIERHSVNAQFHYCSVQANYDLDGARTLRLSIAYSPERGISRQIESWGDNIKLINLNDQNGLVRAGHFNVSINAANPKGWNKDRLKAAIKQLVDLDAVSKLQLK